MINLSPQNDIRSKSKVLPIEKPRNENLLREYKQLSHISTDDYLQFCIKRKLLEIRASPYMSIKHEGDVNSVAFSPCGRYIASGSSDKSLRVWNLYDNREEFKEIHLGAVNTIVYSPNGDFIGLVYNRKSLKLWNIKEKKEYLSDKYSKRIISICFSLDNNFFASRSEGSPVKVWNIKEKRMELIGSDSLEDKNFCFSSDSNFLVIVNSANKIRVWNLLLKKEEFNEELSEKINFCFSPDSNFLVIVNSDNKIRVWNLLFKKEEFNEQHSERINQILISPDSNLLGITIGKFVKVLNLKEYKEVFTEIFPKIVKSIHFSSDSNLLVASFKNGSIKIWKIYEKVLEFESPFDTIKMSIKSITLSSDNIFLKTCNGKKLRVWNIIEKKEVFTLDSDFRGSYFIPGNKLLYITWYTSLEEKYFIFIWNLFKNNMEFSELHPGNMKCSCFSPDNFFFASGSTDNNIYVWTTNAKQELCIEFHKKNIKSICFSSNDSLLLTKNDPGFQCSTILNNKLKVWNIKESQEEDYRDIYKDASWGGFSSDGKYLVLIFESKNCVRIHNIEEKNVEVNLNELIKINSVTFSPNSNYLAILTNGNSIRIWSIIENQFVLADVDKQNNSERKFENSASITFSPDSNFLASVFYEEIFEFWDIKKKKKVFSGTLKEKVNKVYFSPDSNYLAFTNTFLKLLNIKTGKIESRFDVHSLITYLHFSTDGKLIFLKYNGEYGAQSYCYVCKICDNNKLELFTKKDTTSACFSLDSNLVALAFRDYFINIYQIKGKILVFTAKHFREVTSLCFSPDGKFLASGSRDRSIRIWNIKEKYNSFIGYHLDEVKLVLFSNTGSFLASTDGNSIKIWKINGSQEDFIGRHKGRVSSISFSGDSKFLVSGSWDKTVKVWDIKSKNEYFNRKHLREVSSISVSQDSNYFASGSWDKSVKIFNLKTKKEVFTGIHISTVYTVSFSPDSKSVASGSEDGSIKIWEISGNLIFDQKVGGRVYTVIFSPDGLNLASGSIDNLVRIWNIESKSVYVIGNHLKEVIIISYSSDGKFLASGAEDNCVKVWDIKNKKQLLIVEHSDEITSICFSPDCNFLASGSYDHLVKIWNIYENREEFTVNHLDIVTTVSFSPIGNYIASGSLDKSLKIWNLNERREEFNIKLPKEITSVAFSADGNYLAAGTWDNSVKLWIMKDRFVKQVISDKPLVSRSMDKNVKDFTNPERHILSSKYDDNSLKENFKWPAIETDIIKTILLSEKFNVVIIRLVDSENLKVINLEDSSSHNILCESPSSTCISNNGELLAFESPKNNLKIFNIKLNEVQLTVDFSKSITSTCFNNDDRYLALGFEDFSIKLWNTEENNNYTDLKGHNSMIMVIYFLKNDEIMVSGSFDGLIIVWNLSDNNESFNLDGHSKSVNSICFLPKANLIISGSSDTHIKIWSLEERCLVESFQHHTKEVTSISVSREEELIASGSIDETLIVWSLVDKNVVFRKDMSSSVISVRFSIDDNKLAVGLSEGKLIIWNFEEKSKNDNEFKRSYFGYDGSESSSKHENLEISFKEDQLIELHEQKKSNENLSDAIKQSNQIDTNRNNSLRTNSKYEVIQSLFGFDVIDINKEKLHNYSIIEISNLEIGLIVDSFICIKKLEKPLIKNKTLSDLFSYQQYNKCIIDIDTSVISSNTFEFRPCSVNDTFIYSPNKYFTTLDALRSNKYDNIIPKNCKIPLSENKYTLLHFLSFLGQSEVLKNLLIVGKEEIILRADSFGKSPLYYSTMEKHFDCYDLIMEFLIKFNPNDYIRLITCLHSIKNDFTLILKNNQTLLIDFFGLILIKNKNTVKLPISEKLHLKTISGTLNPSVNDFGKKIDVSKNAPVIDVTLKYTGFPIPIRPFSKKNIEILKLLYKLTNKKFYDDIIIQSFIEFNWEAVFPWAFSYSLLVWIHISFFCISFIYPTKIYTIAPYWVTYCLMFLWEFLQIRSSFHEYWYNPWNIVDIFMLIWTPIWSIFRIFNIDLLYSDLILTFLLMIRGIASFKIFNGTRHYIRLILQSLNSIKYFLIIFIYSTLFFSLLLYIVLNNDEEDLNYFDVLKMSWALSVSGDTSIESKYGIILLIIFVSTIFNLILMLNMLISILGDSYDRYSLDKNMIDYREQISLSLEVQTALFWKIQGNKLQYIHILEAKDENRLGDDEDWQGWIKFTELRQEKSIEIMAKKIEEINMKTDQNYSKVDEKLSQFNENQEKLEIKINEINSQLALLIEMKNKE